VVYEPADDAAIEAIFAKKAAGETLTDTEVAQFKTAMLLFCAAQYKKLNWTMQLHDGCRRDNNRVMFEKLARTLATIPSTTIRPLTRWQRSSAQSSRRRGCPARSSTP